MNWYFILFITVFSIFCLKSLVTWFFGEVEIDVDFDGDVDIDVSSMFSFKGILHFLLGFSTILSAIGYNNTHSLTAPYTFPWWAYAFAILIGMLTMVGLFFLYKGMMKLNHYTTDNPKFDGLKGVVRVRTSGDVFNEYALIVYTPQGMHQITAYSPEYFGIGEEAVIKANKTEKRYEISHKF